VVLALLGLMGLVGWQTSQQFVDLTNRLPMYKEALKDKINSMKGASSQTFDDASNTVKELESEIVEATPGSSPEKGRQKSPATPGSSSSHPLAVEVVPPTNLIGSVENMIGPMANAGLVTIFTIFILFSRENLRNRLVRLAGAGQLNLVTQAMDEASQRINRYLLLQFLVNSGYGLPHTSRLLNAKHSNWLGRDDVVGCFSTKPQRGVYFSAFTIRVEPHTSFICTVATTISRTTHPHLPVAFRWRSSPDGNQPQNSQRSRTLYDPSRRA
jgi:hypothetical protein